MPFLSPESSSIQTGSYQQIAPRAQSAFHQGIAVVCTLGAAFLVNLLSWVEFTMGADGCQVCLILGLNGLNSQCR